jgi:hypothetical protein
MLLILVPVVVIGRFVDSWWLDELEEKSGGDVLPAIFFGRLIFDFF